MKTLTKVGPIAAALLLAATAARAEGTFVFNLNGTNPDGKSSYTGTVTTTDLPAGPNGEQVSVIVWRVGKSAPIRGVAMTTPDSPKRISISFPNSPVPGVALGEYVDNGISLQWYIGGKAAGREVWSRR